MYWTHKTSIYDFAFVHFHSNCFSKHSHEQTCPYPVCIECLHVADHTFLYWCWAVAALAGGKQGKCLPSSVFGYRWDTASSERITHRETHTMPLSEIFQEEVRRDSRLWRMFTNSFSCHVERKMLVWALLPMGLMRSRFRLRNWVSRHGRRQISTYSR